MRCCLLLALLFGSASVLAAAEPENGFYLAAEEASAPAVTSQDGHELRLGPRQPLAVQKASLSSCNNQNSQFHLSVTIPYDAKLDGSRYLLLVDGTAYRAQGWGSSGAESSTLDFYVSGEQFVNQVAKHLAIQRVLRRHPGHHLRVSFVPDKAKFAVGEEVTVKLEIANVGGEPVAFRKGGRNRAARDNQYVFSAFLGGKPVADIGTNQHFGGLSVRRVLKPSEVFEDRISLGKWFALDKAGIYEVHGSYYLDFNDPATESNGTIWEDYVSADFIVRIEEPQGTPGKEADGGGK